MAGGIAGYSARVIVTALAIAALAAGLTARADSAAAQSATLPSGSGSGTSGTSGTDSSSGTTSTGTGTGSKKPKPPKIPQIGPSFVQQQWPLRAIRAKSLQLKSHRPLAPVIVATIDSGVYLQHPDLKNILWRNPYPTPAPYPFQAHTVPRGAVGWDMLDNDPQPDDVVGHGTAIAGLIAAQQGNGGVDGVAPNAQLMAMKACWRPQGGDLTCDDASSAAAIDWAATHGARIIHLSWVLGGGPMVSAAINAHPKILFVANSGNGYGMSVDQGKVNCTIPSPNLICVAASTRSGAPAPCTSFGPMSVDVAAPGIGVTTTGLGGRYIHNSPCAVSFAGPHVSGLAAILIGAAPHAQPAAVKAAILAGGLPGYGFEGKTVTGDIIDVPRSLSLLRRWGGAVPGSF
jgi:subtilisin family serine protease